MTTGEIERKPPADSHVNAVDLADEVVVTTGAREGKAEEGEELGGEVGEEGAAEEEVGEGEVQIGANQGGQRPAPDRAASGGARHCCCTHHDGRWRSR